MEHLETKINIKELEDKTFEVEFTRVDKVLPEELLANITQIRESVKVVTEKLTTIDAKTATEKTNFTKDIDVNNNVLKELVKSENKAKLWAEIKKKEAERKPKVAEK